MRPPRFWNDAASPLARCLKPLGKVYGDIVAARAAQEPAYISRLPVICVGNVTVGGAGKTPVVQSIGRLLKEAGKQPAVLLRGERVLDRAETRRYNARESRQPIFNFNFQTPDPAAFKASKNQIAASLTRAVQAGMRGL